LHFQVDRDRDNLCSDWQVEKSQLYRGFWNATQAKPLNA
jgi:hypothetical protein